MTSPKTGGRFRLTAGGRRQRIEPPTRELSRAERRGTAQPTRTDAAQAPADPEIEAAVGSAEQQADDAVADAIRQLDPGDPDAWTAGGKPKTEALAELLGRPVTAAERNRAWSARSAAGNEE